ncbi:MAG TPA: hypothetical protein PLB55_04170 [Prosthecobacter sp.]|jgi:hypothetical protein|nr:hypothetical protein [Prosthecobacter sp.]
MTSSDPWHRAHFRSPSGSPFLFYVLFGEIDLGASLSASTYNVDAVPDELSVMRYDRDRHADTIRSFQEGYLWDQLVATQPAFAQQIAAQSSCVILRGEFPDTESLGYLRNAVGLITHFLDHGAVCVYDPQMFEWWTPENWRERIFKSSAPVPRHHTVILASEDKNGTEWLHTRGMRKFGRPDLSIRQVSQDWRDGAIDLCNRFIELQAFGGAIDEGQEVRMRSVPPGLRCFHSGHLDDPDFNNVHVEIR